MNVRANSARQQPVVIYDDVCRVCTRSARMVQRFDWLHRLDQLPRSTAELHYSDLDLDGIDGLRVRFPDGSMTVGVDAVRSIMVRTIAGIIPGAVLYLPGIHWVGGRAYRWFARNRYRFGGTVSCELPGSAPADSAP